MLMRKTTDAALIRVPQADLDKTKDVISKTKMARWTPAYSKKQETFIIRRRATGRWHAKAAQELENALAKALPKRSTRVEWAWTAGGEERYFPGSEIMVLFEEGTTEAERKKILRKVKGLKVETYPNARVEPPQRRGKRSPSMPFPGFSRAKISQARKLWEAMKPDEPLDPRADRPAEVVIPVARVMVPESRRDEIFDIAGEIRSLPQVRAATPDVSVLGKDLIGEPQQADLPSTSPDSFHDRNRVDFAWRLVNPQDLDAPSDVFLASKEKVAVVDWTFYEHPLISYQWIGYDAADQDHDPRTPTNAESYPHGLRMSGVIGGQGQDSQNQAGIAPGAVIIPVRPSWSTEDDFFEDDGSWYYSDYDEFVERFATNWVNAIVRLYELSLQGVEIANMSISMSHSVWNATNIDLDNWLNWWLREGNLGYGVFACASAGNRPERTNIISIPADVSRVFAVGWGRESDHTMLGNSGWGLELVVDDGRWPYYNEDGTISNAFAQTGGSSVASAVVAGTVAIMKSLNPSLTADEVKAILRLTTRKIPAFIAAASSPFPLTGSILQWPDEDAWDGWGPGYCNQFGNGFLDAHFAAELAWRNHYPAAELLKVKYRYDHPARAMTQLRHPLTSPLAGKRIGKFWSSYSYSSQETQRWLHDRDFRLDGIDQAVDLMELPFAEKILVGDFDGDYVDEIALQLHQSEYWPQVCDHPPQSFLTFKFDETDERWKSMGKRSPYASGLAAPQVVFPPEQPPNDMLVADLKGDHKKCLVAWGGEMINALQYDEGSDTFQRLDPIDYKPSMYSSIVDQATGQGAIVSQRILKVAPLKRGGFRELLMIVGSFTKFGTGAVLGTELQEMQPAPFSPYEGLPHLPGTFDFTGFTPSGTSGTSSGRMGLRHYMTFSILGYDETTSQWVNYSFSSNPEDTHILLDETSVHNVESILPGEFAFPGEASLNEVVIHLDNDHFHTMLFSNMAGHTYNLYYVYKNELDLEGRISRVKAGRFGFDGDKTQLAWLDDVDHGNRVRFLQWNDVMREWQPANLTIGRPRPDNRAIDLAVLEGFTFANLDGDQAVIALLMAEPDANVYFTYRYGDSGAFKYMGLI